MNSLIMCTAVTLNIFSAPGGTVVGSVPAYKAVQIDDVSLLRDMVFVSKPGPEDSSPRGWIQYGGLETCSRG
jgi:hypothetical protein